MGRHLYPLAALAALVVAASLRAADPEDSAVQVVRPTGKGNASGTVVHTDGTHSWVLTNRHVVSESPHGRVRDDWQYGVRCRGRHYPAELRRWGTDVDLALLKVPAVLPAAKLAAAEPPAGAEVRLFGYGGPPLKGKALGCRGEAVPGTGESFRADVTPTNGDSGSALFNSAGEVVGVCWGWMGEQRHLAAVRLPAIRAVLAEEFGAPAAPRPEAVPPERVKPKSKADTFRPPALTPPAAAVAPAGRPDCLT